MMLGGNYGPPYPVDCRAAWDGKYVNENGLHGSGQYYLAVSASDTATATLQRLPLLPPLVITSPDHRMAAVRCLPSHALVQTL